METAGNKVILGRDYVEPESLPRRRNNVVFIWVVLVALTLIGIATWYRVDHSYSDTSGAVMLAVVLLFSLVVMTYDILGSFTGLEINKMTLIPSLWFINFAAALVGVPLLLL